MICALHGSLRPPHRKWSSCHRICSIIAYTAGCNLCGIVTIVVDSNGTQSYTCFKSSTEVPTRDRLSHACPRGSSLVLSAKPIEIDALATRHHDTFGCCVLGYSCLLTTRRPSLPFKHVWLIVSVCLGGLVRRNLRSNGMQSLRHSVH